MTDDQIENMIMDLMKEIDYDLYIAKWQMDNFRDIVYKYLEKE